MKKKTYLTLAVAAFSAAQASAMTVQLQAVADANFLGSNVGQDRNEMILGVNAGTERFGAVRFDVSSVATDLTTMALTAATITLHEQAGRDALNGSQSVSVGAALFSTANNSGWTPANISSGSGFTWFGNSQSRPGNFGGVVGGNNNLDQRGTSVDLAGTAATIRDGVSTANLAFAAGQQDSVEIDLTAAGATLSDLQAIFVDWSNGNNAGVHLQSTASSQIFFTSVGTANAGLGEVGNGSGPVTTLNLTFGPVVPEPSSAALAALGGLGLFARRRR